MYELKQDLHIKDKVLKAGDIVEAKAIPKQSLSWLLEQEIIVKVDRRYKENKLQELAKQEEE
jgi:hypothetical protein